MVKHLLKIISLLLFTNLLIAQSNNEIDKKNKELSGLQTEISSLEKKLQDNKSKKDDTRKALENIDNQSLLLNKLITKLKKEENLKENEIKSLSSDIKEVEGSIENLKVKYARYIKWLYKNGRNSTLKFLVSSTSLNQAVVRYKYLKDITDENEKTLDELEKKKNKLVNLKNKVKTEERKKERLVSQKQREEITLQIRKKDREDLFTKLNSSEGALLKEIEDKRKYEIRIKSMVANLIKEERLRLAKLNEERLKSGSSSLLSYSYENFENFEGLKGKLNWPVSKGKIFRKFGENKNKRLKTVTLNYGVDIEAARNSEVYAVAEGVVSAIEWIPGYGSIVIITHKDDFRTVYGHLKDIAVDEGDIIIGGSYIGAVNQRLEGNIIHFEIWNERNYQNPEQWLVKK